MGPINYSSIGTFGLTLGSSSGIVSGMELISSAQAAIELGICQRAVRKLLERGKLAGAKLVGRQWVIPSPVARINPARGPQPKSPAAQAAYYASSATPEWSTPPSFVAFVVQVLESIDLDPCSNAEKTIPAKCHFTQEEDGLSHDWYGRVYMNPPYGDIIGKWVKHLCREYAAGRTKEAIALVPARTDTQWFSLFSEFPQCFLRGRLKFGGGETSAPFPSVAIYLGPNVERFADVFSDIGKVTR